MKVKRQNVQKSMSIEAARHLVSNCNDDRMPQRTNDVANHETHDETDIIDIHHDAYLVCNRNYLSKN